MSVWRDDANERARQASGESVDWNIIWTVSTLRHDLGHDTSSTTSSPCCIRVFNLGPELWARQGGRKVRRTRSLDA